MKTNDEGKFLIRHLETEWEPEESRTAAEKAIALYVTSDLNHNQFSAIVPLIMHVGIEKFRKSRLIKHINKISSDNPAVLGKIADEWMLFEVHETNENDERFIDPFLLKQREYEVALFRLPYEVPKRKK